MAVFHLVRHGRVDAPEGLLPGRRPGFSLHPSARERVQQLIPRLQSEAVQHLYASPLERTRETAEILAAGLQLKVQPAPELLELDYGDWTHKYFTELDAVTGWREYNTFRSATPIPGGEWILQTQVRAVGFILRLREEIGNQSAVLVTHADVIRCILTYFLGMPIDLLLRLEIEPASLSTLRLDRSGVQVLATNWVSPSVNGKP